MDRHTHTRTPNRHTHRNYETCCIVKSFRRINKVTSELWETSVKKIVVWLQKKPVNKLPFSGIYFHKLCLPRIPLFHTTFSVSPVEYRECWLDINSAGVLPDVCTETHTSTCRRFQTCSLDLFFKISSVCKRLRSNNGRLLKRTGKWSFINGGH
jgi:hypothetical protein